MVFVRCRSESAELFYNSVPHPVNHLAKKKQITIKVGLECSWSIPIQKKKWNRITHLRGISPKYGADVKIFFKSIRIFVVNFTVP